MRTWPTGIHSTMTKTAARGYEHRVCELCAKTVRVGQLYRPMRHKVCGDTLWPPAPVLEPAPSNDVRVGRSEPRCGGQFSV